DAGMHRQPNGTAIAIMRHVVDASAAARSEASAHFGILAQLDRDLANRLGVVASAPRAAMSGDWRARIQELMVGIVGAASREERMLIAVDDIDEADDGSLAMLAGLLRLTEQSALSLVLSAPDGVEHKSKRPWELI